MCGRLQGTRAAAVILQYGCVRPLRLSITFSVLLALPYQKGKIT